MALTKDGTAAWAAVVRKEANAAPGHFEHGGSIAAYTAMFAEYIAELTARIEALERVPAPTPEAERE